jgi:FtsP/CotA-like multicopper oxidase with cupredoxin domain
MRRLRGHPAYSQRLSNAGRLRRLLALGCLLGICSLLGLAGAASASARTDVYWVAAVPVTWNVIPDELDPMMPKSFLSSETIMNTVLYRRYTPGWRQPDPELSERPGDEAGIQGPLLHARVGDRIVVHFKNLDTLFNNPHSMHFHGVSYRPSSDGSFIPGFSGPGATVAPGESFTYRLTAGPESAGVWPYHDHSPSMEQSLEGGLYGALSILGRDERTPDREFVSYLTQTLSYMTIDGRAFLGNTPIFHSRVGQVVQWDVLTIGNEFHTFHVHGHRWVEPGGVSRDTRTIGPAESFRVRWREDAPGTWLYHCHVEAHMMNGMIGLYRVAGR